MILAVIVAVEIAFWALLVAGLTARYVLRLPRAGAALLVAVPLVDLVLLAATVIDLRGGATAGAAHGLAAVYIGVSVAFGRRMIRWADVRFAHRFAGGPAPERSPRTGPAHARREREAWYRHLLAWTVGAALIGLAVALVGDLDRTEAMLQLLGVWTLVLAIDFVVSFSYTLWPRGGRDRDRHWPAAVRTAFAIARSTAVARTPPRTRSCPPSGPSRRSTRPRRFWPWLRRAEP
jgi:hypothetical protein